MSEITPTTTFEALGLNENLLSALKDMGFETPTPIQQQAIPLLLSEDRDLIGLAQTGTGKTAAFGLPLLNRVDFTERFVQGLIICPTRELCMQITRDLDKFAKDIPKAKIVAVYGGSSIDNQRRDIERGAQIVVATPGRIIDLLNRGYIKINQVQVVVLDEADEMLNMGFKEDIDQILETTPEEKLTWLFSATMPREVRAISKNYMSNPIEISSGKANSGAENIEHHYYVVHAKDRYAALRRIADYYPEMFGMVFCRTRMETHEVAHHLIKDGYNADALHGDLSQQQRDQVMHKFRSRQLQFLVATDVAARGIDVSDISHVINYNLPDDIENYTHRSGRTARAGKSGISLILVNTREVGRIREIERQIGKKFIPSTIPTGFEICTRQLMFMVDKIKETEINKDALNQFLPEVFSKLEEFSKEDLILKVVSTEFNRFLDIYKNTPDLNVSQKKEFKNDRDRSDRNDRNDRNDRSDSRDKGSMRGRQQDEITGRYFVNVGEMDGMDVDKLRDWISDCTGIATHEISRIRLKDAFSFFETEPDKAPLVLEGLSGRKHNGRKIRVDNAANKEEARPRAEGGGFRGGNSGGGSGFRRSEKPAYGKKGFAAGADKDKGKWGDKPPRRRSGF